MAKLITFRGKSQTIPAWASELGIPESTIRSRLDKLKQTVEQALGTPSDKRFSPVAKIEAGAGPRHPPKLQRDARGNAFVRWTDSAGARKKKYFGPWGRVATNQAYSRWAAEWHAGYGLVPEPGEQLSVAAVVVAYLQWAAINYQKNGKPTSEIHSIRAALKQVNALYGNTAASELTPTRLMAVQTGWVRAGLSLKTVNGYLNRVVRCWSWAVGRGMLPAAVADALAHVAPIKPGRGVARPEPVRSAEVSDVERAIPYLHSDPARQQVLAAIVRLQLCTGMRPGEVLELRPVDVDRSREPWLYCPASGGKAMHLEKTRRVWLGPRARAILEPLLRAGADATAGSGSDSVRVFRVARRAGGGDAVNIRIEWYRACLAAACRAAGVEVVTPHQLRHTRATELHKLYEDDAMVAASLGNTPEVARQVYVDGPADAAAKRIAEATG